MDLFDARMKKRITQWDLKKLIGVHQSKISLIERGYIIPTDKEKELIAKALGFRVSEIEWPVEQNGNLNSLMTSNFKK